jgi:hypothetical protein
LLSGFYVCHPSVKYFRTEKKLKADEGEDEEKEEV